MRAPFPPLRFLALAALGLASASAQPASAPAPTPAPTPAPPAATPAAAAAPATPSTDELFTIGQQLFDQLATPEIKAQYDFPSKTQWDAFAARLQTALAGDDLRTLATYAPEGRTALAALRAFPEYSDYAAWLAARLDEIEAAEQLTTQKPARPPLTPTSPPSVENPKPKIENSAAVPHYELWLTRVRAHPAPTSAGELMPRLRAAFTAEGVPPELAWLAEAESTLNQNARSPTGARGLFQLMPDTAKGLGLGTFLPDERTDPEKSAHAAARLLRSNYEKFGSWPLALAAYNAGPGRISRLLEKTSTKTYAGIAAALPAETRMYVPKVYALVATRAGVSPEKIPAPGRG